MISVVMDMVLNLKIMAFVFNFPHYIHMLNSAIVDIPLWVG